MPVTPAASSVTLNQTQVEIVGRIDKKSGFYAIAVTARARIVYGSWPSVSPLTTGPTARGVPPSRHFKVEADALQYMVGQLRLQFTSLCAKRRSARACPRGCLNPRAP